MSTPNEPLSNQPADSVPPVPTSPEGVATPPPPAATVPLPPENVTRGLLLSLIVIPLGVIVFTLIFQLGFIASIVGFGVAFGAFFLYRLGSGGRLSMKGALVVAGVTLVTLVLAFIIAELWGMAQLYADTSGLPIGDILSSPQFLPFAIEDLTNPVNAGAVLGDAALTFLFGALGCFTIIRGAFKEAKATATPPVAPPAI